MSGVFYGTRGVGVELRVDGEKIEQISTVLIDHTGKWMRVRMFASASMPIQERLRNMPLNAAFTLTLKDEEGTREFKDARVRFCRSRISGKHITVTTAEFLL